MSKFNINDEVFVFARYLFATPKLAKISDFSDVDTAIEIELLEFGNSQYSKGALLWVHPEQLRISKCKHSKSIEEKPPIGLTPKFIWLENRLSEITNACHRYSEAGKEIPVDWINQGYEILSEMSEYYKHKLSSKS